MKLLVDERDALNDILGHEGMQAFWKEAAACLSLMQMRVLEYNLESGNPTELAHLKCRAEGAAHFLNALKKRVEPNKQPLIDLPRKRQR